MFGRRPEYGKPMWRFEPRGAQPENGCDARIFADRDKVEQSAEWLEWVVAMVGETRTIQARDAESAAVKMWFTLRQEGCDVDKMVLFDKRYTVRET